jgi:hypothetical protein
MSTKLKVILKKYIKEGQCHFLEMKVQDICANDVWLRSRTLAHQADLSIYKNNRNERSWCVL